MKVLHAGQLYWPTTVNQTKEYPALRQNIQVQAAVIGGGMSGALCASVLVRNGLNVVLLERNQVAGGSTSANTGLLQFCNDIMLCDLMKQIGRPAAGTFYKGCKDAIDMLSALAHQLPADVGFKRRSSLYYATSEQDLPKLMQEYETLLACGFDVEYWDDDDISRHFPFSKPGAIVTHGDAEVNPYHFIIELTEQAADDGLQVHENTDIVQHDTSPDGLHRLRTADGYEIETQHVVYAVGYEPEELRGRLIKASLNRTFAVVTGIQPSLQEWHQRFMLWETARPYLYLRTTVEGRVIVGGLDDEISKPLQGMKALRKRSVQLMERLQALFPGLQSSIEYEWNAVFGESRDGLPFIGEDPARKNVYYSLGYGGNGTVYSMMAAELLRDLILGRPHPLADIVKLSRETLLDAADRDEKG